MEKLAIMGGTPGIRKYFMQCTLYSDILFGLL